MIEITPKEVRKKNGCAVYGRMGEKEELSWNVVRKEKLSKIEYEEKWICRIIILGNFFTFIFLKLLTFIIK